MLLGLYVLGQADTQTSAPRSVAALERHHPVPSTRRDDRVSERPPSDGNGETPLINDFPLVDGAREFVRDLAFVVVVVPPMSEKSSASEKGEVGNNFDRSRAHCSESCSLKPAHIVYN